MSKFLKKSKEKIKGIKEKIQSKRKQSGCVDEELED